MEIRGRATDPHDKQVKQMIYLDNAATTRPFDEVMQEIQTVNDTFFANPSSMHTAGYLAEKKIKEAKGAILASIGATDGTFLYTSGGTESNNLAFFGTLQSAIRRKPHIITTKIEHPSVLEPLHFLENLGAEVTYADVDERGFVSPEQLASLVRENTKIVSVMGVNNETGAIQPLSEIAKAVKRKKPDILFHTDCVQALGNIPIDVKKMSIDMMSVSAHKINGPKGVGGFYFGKNVHLKPALLGGHQQDNLRSGTLNTPGICGFAKALSLTMESAKDKRETLSRLKERLITRLADCDLFSVNNTGDGYAPHIISLRVKNVRSEVLLHALETHGICISAGSACSSARPSPSHVLTAMGYDRKKIEETVRISTGAFTTKEDIDTFCEIIKKEAKMLSEFTRI